LFGVALLAAALASCGAQTATGPASEPVCARTMVFDVDKYNARIDEICGNQP
jgi:hypothetical protein